jgi:iron complex outermembrane receptor protein
MPGVPVSEGTDIQRFKQYSDEAQILGTLDGGDLDWIIGGFLYHETGDTSLFIQSAAPLASNNADVVNDSQALYAQATWKLPFYRALSLTVGGRYTWDQRKIEWRNFLGANCALLVGNVGSAPLSPCVAQSRVSFRRPTYTLALDWTPTDRLLVYGTSRRGYRAGGYDLSVRTVASRLPFDSEVVTDSEGGLKYDFNVGNARGRVNLAVYRTNYDNMQRSVPTVVTENGITQFIARTTNAASAVVTGYELEAFFKPTPSLELSAMAGLVHPHYKRYVTGAGVDLSANAFSSTPERTYGAGCNGPCRLTLLSARSASGRTIITRAPLTRRRTTPISPPARGSLVRFCRPMASPTCASTGRTCLVGRSIWRPG